MHSDPQALAAYLKARRAARSPEAAGLPGGGRRRTPGLRREELAALAGVSVDYLIRLEQGRHPEPSADVLGALANALGLNAAGRRHLFRLGGRPDPGPRVAAAAHVSEPLRRLLERASPSPAWVINRRRDVVLHNDAAEALLGPLAPERRNLLHLVFLDPAARDLWVEWDVVARDTVAQLRASVADVALGGEVAAMISTYRDASEDFADLWARHDVARACNPVRPVRHPAAGELVFELELLDAADGDLQVVVLEPLDADSRARWIAHMAGRGATAGERHLVAVDGRRGGAGGA